MSYKYGVLGKIMWAATALITFIISLFLNLLPFAYFIMVILSVGSYVVESLDETILSYFAAAIAVSFVYLISCPFLMLFVNFLGMPIIGLLVLAASHLEQHENPDPLTAYREVESGPMPENAPITTPLLTQTSRIVETAQKMTEWGIHTLRKNSIQQDREIKIFMICSAWLIIYLHNKKGCQSSQALDITSKSDFNKFIGLHEIQTYFNIEPNSCEYFAIKTLLQNIKTEATLGHDYELTILNSVTKSCALIAEIESPENYFESLFDPIINENSRVAIISLIKKHDAIFSFIS